MSSLAHHGVKGQKWGVRRYQNPDGTRTQAGKRRDLETRRTRRATKSKAIVDSIIASMNDDDRDLLNVGDDGYLSVEQGKYIAKRILVKDDKGEYVSFVDLLEDGDGLNGIVGTKSGDNYRGKGYASKAAKEALDWYDKNADKYGYTKLTVGAKKRNVKSQGLAEKSNFDKVSSDDDWVVYEYKGKKVKHSSIGGNMNYIYGNTLVLGDASYLAHHGILGQKWGIRRFQNKDGSRTAEGKKRYRSRRTVFEDYQNAQLDNVISNNKYNYKRHPIKYNPIKRSILKKKADDLRSEYDDVLKNGRTNSGLFQKPRKGSISLTANEKKETLDAVRTADIEIRKPEYRFHNKVSVLAAATEKSTINVCKKLAWYDAKRMDNEERRFVISEDLEDMYASFKKKNPGSQKEQFEKFNKIPEVKKLTDESHRLFDENEQLRKEQASECHRIAATVFDTTEWSKPFGEPRDGYNETYLSVLERAINVNSVMYASREAKKNIEHSLTGGNMNYIYGNTLILGDTSYLEHHGIKNQKWGIRRFQNPDGSLTAAGRIRYGVTGAAKAAFKVGKKLGAATASAARAGVKKAKDNAYAKKKEKASQTREGVLKNKKMFTSDELKALENRFKIEDEMSEASLRHGQAVAKTVSQYANTTRDVLSALQTGGNAVSAITKAFADIQSYKNAKGVAEAAKEKGMTTKEFDLFLKEKYPNAKKDDGSKKKGKNSNKAEHSDSEDDDDDDNPPNNGGGGGSKKQAEYAAKRQAAQETIYKQKASGLKQREDYLNKRQDALVKVSKQRQSEQDARDEDLNRRDKAASERESKLKETAKTAADVMSKLNKRQADLDKKESFLNSIESYRLDTLSEFKKNEEEAARRKKKKVKHSAIGEEMYADYLEHFGTKGMKWGVRRYQNPDGTLTDAGRKHYQKKLDLEERKLTAANAARGQYERVRPAATAGSAIVGAIVGASLGAASMLTPAGIAAGAAYMAAVSGASMYARISIKGAVAGAGAKRSKKKISKYKEALSQDGFQIQNGVLMYGFAPSDELEHFGLKGMKWGVRRFQNKDGSLTEAGKQRYANTGNLDSGGGGGGGAPEEEDEETKKAIEEAAKKAGMTVDEYRKKFADKVAALKEKARDAAWDARYAAEDAADAVSGKTSKEIAEKSAKSAEENERKAKAARKEGRDEDAAKYEEWAKQSREISEYRQGKYEKSLAGRVEATSRKIGAKAQEAKDKLKSRAPKRSIALEVANTGPVPVGQTEIHTADVLNKYYGAMVRARKTAANSTAAQRAKYGDRQNIRERAEAEELNNLRAREKRDEAIRLRMAKKFDKKADSARSHGNIAKAEAFEKESNRQFNKAPVAGSKAEAFEAVRDSKLASHLVRNAATAKRAQSATLAENRNRNAAHLAERRREKAINEAKAKIRSGKLPVNELTRYAKSSVGQLKSAAKAELARREREQALTSMGSDYARATARVTTTSSTTNTTDAHNEKLARDRRDKRKQASRASATAKKNRLAGSGRKKYTSGQTSSIGRVGSGRGKTSTRR